MEAFLDPQILQDKKRGTTIGGGRGEIWVTQKLHIKNLDYYPPFIYILNQVAIFNCVTAKIKLEIQDLVCRQNIYKRRFAENLIQISL